MTADAQTRAKIIAIIGPTASGKSALAMELAKEIGRPSKGSGQGEILSVDSMQIYRGMDIGTAKPTRAEQAAVRHHLIDIADPNETFTVARFVELADAVITDAAKRNVPLIATGGTPMYFKALFEGLFEGPSTDATIRALLADQTNEQLHQRLTQIDPAAAARIHMNDRRRMIRAIEVFELSGQPISSLQTDWQGEMSRHPAVWIGLDWEREELNRRVNARVKQMLAAGWLDETRQLLQRHGDLSKTAAGATGYPQLIAHLRGELSLDEATEQIKIATRQLARKQMKWFRRFPKVTWFKGDQNIKTALQTILCG
jgi:tRNA dimethylallyltransferase